MREIKFRAWHEKNNVMLFVGDDYGTTHPLDCCKYFMDRQPLILMQYTGLKDKNGTEIYEGDVVKHWTYNGEVLVIEWDSEQASFFAIRPRAIADYELLDMNSEMEVIGNIHENPELLNAPTMSEPRTQ